MKILSFLFFLSHASYCALVVAQPATYENGVLSIPQGAALVDGVPSYYNDIQLLSDIEGNFTLIEAQERQLVAVAAVTVNIAESLPVQVSVTIAGNKSIPCVDLQSPAIFRNDTQITVVLAETVLGPAESCISVLAPFETTIALDVTGLESGSYTVNVNGVEAELNL